MSERDDVSVSEIRQPLPPGQFGPLQRGGRTRGGRGGWRRVGVFATVFLAAAALTASLSAGALLWYGEQSMTRLHIPGLASPVATGGVGGEVDEITDVLNVLLVGDDSREGLTDDQLRALGTERVSGGRTDTIMLLQVDPARDNAALLSFPRDLLVTRCDGSRGRINAAYGIGEEEGVGGGACLVETVADFTDIPIHHYVEVNFAGFIDVVDVLGGVTLYVEEPGLRDRYAGLDLDPGCQRLGGTQALGFVRARHLDSDFGRIARQQRFIHELMNEVTSAGTLLNVPRLLSLVDAGGRMVETDQELSLADMRRIAFSLRNLTADQLDTRTVPAVPRGGYVVGKEEEAEDLFQAFRDGSVAPDELGREPPQDVAVDDVPALLVLNGAGIDGLAGQAAEVLESHGFTVEDTDNAEHFDFEATEVIHPANRLEEGELVADALADVELVAGDADDRLTVVVGAEFDPDDQPEPERGDGAEPESTPEPQPEFRGAESARGRC